MTGIPALPIDAADDLESLRDVIGSARVVAAVPTIAPLPPDER